MDATDTVSACICPVATTLATCIAGLPVNPEADPAEPDTLPVTSPTTEPVNDVACIPPVITILPEPFNILPLISKLPPSCGVISSTRSCKAAEPPPILVKRDPSPTNFVAVITPALLIPEAVKSKQSPTASS